MKNHNGIGINLNWEAGKHTDDWNVAYTSRIIGLGDYGEKTWTDKQGNEVTTAGELMLYKTGKYGNKIAKNDVLLNIKHNWTKFNSNQQHEVQPWSGNRITITTYLDQRWKSTKQYIPEFGEELVKYCEYNIDTPIAFANKQELEIMAKKNAVVKAKRVHEQKEKEKLRRRR